MLRRFIALFALVLILIAVPAAVVSSLRDTSSRGVAPLGHFLVRQSTGIRNFFSSITQIGTLRNDKQDLQKQVLELQQQLADRESLARENDALRKELGVTGVTRDFKKALGQVIIQGNDALDHTYTVDVGAADGIKVGQPAVYQGFLVGRVIDVREHSSIVRAITSQKSRVQTWIAETREEGLLVGDGNTVTLKDITQGVEVKANSLVETSGLGGSLPQGILVGQTGALQSAKSDASQSFRVNLPYDPNNLESIFVLLVDVAS